MRLAFCGAAILACSLGGCGGGGGGGGASPASAAPPPTVNIAPRVTVQAVPRVSGLDAVTVTAAVTDPDGTISSTHWVQLSGPPVGFQPDELPLAFTAPDVDVPTELRFELSATDDDGATGSASVAIVVETTQFYERVPLPFDEGIEFFQSHLGSADFNGDGLEDVIAFRYRFNENIRGRVDLFLNAGGTVISAGDSIIDGPPLELFQPARLEIRDFNRDGRPDVFVAAGGIDSSPDGEPNGLLLSSGNGRMTNVSHTLPTDIGYTHGSASGDIDGDGDDDIVVNNFGGIAEIANNYVLLNGGQGVFTAATDRLPDEFEAGAEYEAIGDSLLTDVDGDGDLDLVVGEHGIGRPSRWYANDGSGSFRNTSFVELPTPMLGSSLALVTTIEDLDADNDGDRDLVVTYYSGPPNPFKGGVISVLINDGNGGFSAVSEAALPHSRFEIGTWDIWVARLEVADWNADGRDDLFVTDRLLGPHAVGELAGVTPPVWLSNGDGTFRGVPQAIFPLVETEGGGTWNHGELIDLDGDGGRDMLHLGYKWQLLRQRHDYTR